MVNETGGSNVLDVKHMQNDILGEKLLNVGEVAKILRVHPNTVYGLIAAGTLKAKEIGRRKIVSESSLKEFLAAS